MSPKQKAKELVYKYQGGYKNNDGFNYPFNNDFEDAKQCALIAVDEVRYFHNALFYVTKGSLLDKYLDEVKIEIEKL